MNIRKILFCVLMALCILGCTDKQQADPVVPAVTVEPMPTTKPTVDVPVAPRPSEEIRWVTFSKDVVDDIMNNKKCSVVFVRENNCPKCDLMENVTLADSDVIKEINDKFIPILVEEPDDELKKILYIEEVPSMLIVPSLDGNFILIVQGPVSRMEMMMHLQREEFSTCSN